MDVGVVSLVGWRWRFAVGRHESRCGVVSLNGWRRQIGSGGTSLAWSASVSWVLPAGDGGSAFVLMSLGACVVSLAG